MPGEEDPVILLGRASRCTYCSASETKPPLRDHVPSQQTLEADDGFGSGFGQGLGETRRTALVAHFGSVAKLKTATVEEIMQVPGIGETTATAVLAALGTDSAAADAGAEARALPAAVGMMSWTRNPNRLLRLLTRPAPNPVAMTRLRVARIVHADDGAECTVTTDSAKDSRTMDFLLVTGLSGAGLSTAAKVLEDLGWYVADNLPPELISRMVGLSLTSDPPVDRLAVVIDVRSRLFTGDLGWVLTELEAEPIHTRVLYLEASDDVLIRRFEQVRRSHPLQNDGIDGTLSEGIAAERRQLAVVKAAADLVIDTSALKAHQLRQKIETAFGNDANRTMKVTVQSFGFKYGLPMDADLVCDVRFLPNPHWIPELRPHTGQDADVRDYVLSRERGRLSRHLPTSGGFDDRRISTRRKALHDNCGRMHRR